eukprot:m.27031 g.27031  ORF g.27031 m.27031 type:complete len:461 (-) comp10159_c0_seq3:140-1522(-)
MEFNLFHALCALPVCMLTLHLCSICWMLFVGWKRMRFYRKTTDASIHPPTTSISTGSPTAATRAANSTASPTPSATPLTPSTTDGSASVLPSTSLNSSTTTATTNTRARSPLSMIKPLKGAAETLEENLTSCFNALTSQDELLICVESERDSALPIARLVASRYPHIRCVFFTAASQIGLNPKINNIYKAFNSCTHDIVWIHDANMFIDDRDTPRIMMSLLSLRPKVGMVHQVPTVMSSYSIVNTLEQVYFATQHAHVYIFADVIRDNCVNGMSIMFKRSVFIENTGGLASFAHHVAEDFFMTKAMHQCGYTHVLAPLPSKQNAGDRPLRAVVERHLRWFRLRRGNTPFLTIWEPFSECVPVSMLILVVGHIYGQGHLATQVASLVVFSWFLVDLAMFLTLTRDVKSWSLVLCCWIIREIMALPMFIRGIVSREIQWRGRQFVIYSSESRETNKDFHKQP